MQRVRLLDDRVDFLVALFAVEIESSDLFVSVLVLATGVELRQWLWTCCLGAPGEACSDRFQGSLRVIFVMLRNAADK